MTDICYICNSTIEALQWTEGVIFHCPVCGDYEPSETFLIRGRYWITKRHLLSGAIRENNEKGITPKFNSSYELISSVRIPQNVFDKIDRILLHIASLEDSMSVGFEYDELDYSLAYAKDYNEFIYLLNLAIKLVYLERGVSSVIFIAVNGWKRLEEINQTKININQAFVAMWFNPELNEAFRSDIIPALEQTGYVPLRLDLAEHNDKIDDRIVADIRKSGLLIADFTGQRANVYFEVGFAMGLGIPVIWTCRKDFLEALHFDTRQYNYIEWETPNELKEKLINRIEALYPLK